MSAERREGTLAGRVRRYARVSTAMGGVAARLVGGRYLGLGLLDDESGAADLAAALGGLKGPLMKVAQILSTVPDALPGAYVEQLSRLQSNAPPMGWPFVRRRMRAELGPDWERRFAAFEHASAAAASLGQVHRARAKDGRALACKLQYPDMQSVVEADLRQLRIVFAIWRRYDNAVDPSEIHAELSERLHEELDYAREARHMRLYRTMLADEPGVRVPEVLDELSTRRLLTMTWLEGVPLMAFLAADPPLAARNRVAHNMFRAWYVPFYDYGIIHGDPHLGNYTVRPDHAVNLLDFGCIRLFPASFVKGVLDLYQALKREDAELAVAAYETWGFKGLSREVIEVLNIWARFVYAPLMEDRRRRIQEAEGGLYGARVAARVHRELRRVGGVKVPREFVLMDRAAIGLGSVFMHLKAEVNWYRLFEELIHGFEVERVAARQREAVAAAGLG